MNYCKTCAFKTQLGTKNADIACNSCIYLIGAIPSEYTPDSETKCKEILASMFGGDTNDSLHNLAKKLIFGNDTKTNVDFKYSSIFAGEYDGDPVCIGRTKESTLKMSPDRFKELLDELDGNSLQTLKEKNARYSTDGDCLHNFRSGAEIMGRTPAQTCWGYMTKHLTSLRDKVEANDFSDREDFLEKCQDTINYIRFLWCIGNDELDKNKEKESN